jgi:hypothetical protein
MLPVVADALGIEVMELFQDATGSKPAKKSKADQLREECDRWLNRTKSEDTLRTMSVILKALSSQGKAGAEQLTTSNSGNRISFQVRRCRP